jgi:rhomboid protease GluP
MAFPAALQMTITSSTPDGEILPPVSGSGFPHADSRDIAEAEHREETGSGRSGWGIDLSAAPATYALLGINCAVFLWMVLSGVSFQSPTSHDLVLFGANKTSLVQDHGQWYRLVTATFVHVGWIHLATNMWCLWNLGMLGEPLLGPLGLSAVYLLTGAAGNLLSMAVNVYNRTDSVGAGASGAVFGIAGMLIVLLSNRKLPIPWSELQRLRRSVIQFAVLNLVIGGATIFFDVIRIDNYAHVGGFASGLAMGVPLVPRMTSGRQKYLLRQKITFAASALVLSLFGYWIANLH